MRVGIVLLALLGALVACAGDDGLPGDADRPGEEEGPPDAKADGSLTSELTFVRRGGFAGVDQQLVLEPDGTATIVTNEGETEPLELSDDQVGRLRELVANTDFEQLAAATGDEDVQVDDDFVYELRYGPHDLAVEDSALGAEKPPLIDELNAVLDEHAW